MPLAVQEREQDPMGGKKKGGIHPAIVGTGRRKKE